MRRPTCFLTRRVVVLAYAVLNQGAHSIHRSAPDNVGDETSWQSLQSYYFGRRDKLLQRITEELGSRLSEERTLASRVVFRTELEHRSSWAPAFVGWINTWLHCGTTEFTLPMKDVEFIRMCLSDLHELLRREKQPPWVEIEALRKDLVICEYSLRCHCGMLSEFHQARHIEHFRQSPHLDSVPIERFLG
jgi:hypothetical protein